MQAIVNPAAVGFPFVGDVLVDVVPWKLAEVSARLAAMPSVCYVSKAYAGNQLSIEINARTQFELMTFVQRVVNQMEGVVHTHTMVVPHLIKDVALWEIPALRFGAAPDQNAQLHQRLKEEASATVSPVSATTATSSRDSWRRSLALSARSRGPVAGRRSCDARPGDDRAPGRRCTPGLCGPAAFPTHCCPNGKRAVSLPIATIDSDVGVSSVARAWRPDNDKGGAL